MSTDARDGQGFHDLHHLLLDNGELFDLAGDVQLDADLRQQCLRPLARRALVHVPESQRWLAVEEDVVGHVEAADQAELLEDDADSGELGLVRVAEGNRGPVQEHLSGVRLVDAGEDLHEGRFPGAVLADQAVDFSPRRNPG